MIQRLWHALFGHAYGPWLPTDEGICARLCPCSQFTAQTLLAPIYCESLRIEYSPEMVAAMGGDMLMTDRLRIAEHDGRNDFIGEGERSLKPFPTDWPFEWQRLGPDGGVWTTSSKRNIGNYYAITPESEGRNWAKVVVKDAYPDV